MKKILFSGCVLVSVLFGDSFTNSIGMTFIEIPEGDFSTGNQAAMCPKDNPYTEVDEYQVCIDKIAKSDKRKNVVHLQKFYMQTTEVTQEQWYAIMGNNPSKFKTGNPAMPVEQISFNEARKFVKLLNAKEGTSKYDLPTEAQWEYVSCAGKPIEYNCEEDTDRCVNILNLKNVNPPSPVASSAPNDWGIYDMRGNVWEWTKECYLSSEGMKKKDDTPSDEPKCTTCCWVNLSDECNAIFRFNYSSNYRYFPVGFRITATKN
ncbi:formylglycine-generating enzyme family protein [Sulfurospirillum deleyianum]|uniref:Sulfatase-modifying factor enzyme-like domain-containing protein n=1 Tax=Sulfurospirillum deleyianum (strain ATCC 51133 / DSM 6946 / 5175) TaxID=525898 RepID=D1B336_SULD5|nr:formylglycine-generating enzyme family protein [Sulfurospirillum deleyianum]ACZ12506.1 protein of unknown function DUF323 [Sulfurospirillum deleyianum DSM 6946]